MSKLLELAERCEKATGPDRELNRAIALACGWTVLMVQKDEWLCPPNGTPTTAPRYTASLDAAMTLVPEGAIWEIGHNVNYPSTPGEPSMVHYAFVNDGKPGNVASYTAKAFGPPALALCSAALRAKQSTNAGKE